MISDTLLNRKAIRSLRVGVVPFSHVLYLTVGVNAIISTLDKEIRKATLGQCTPLIISDEWGYGKTNLLAYVREYAHKKEFVTSFVSLNGRSSPINHPQRFFHRIVADLRFPDVAVRGLMCLLDSIHSSPPLYSAASQWISSNLHASDLAKALQLYLLDRDSLASQVIMGTDLYWADHKKLKAISRLADLGSFIKNLGYKGLMIEFDEMETLGQLWNITSRQGAYRHLNFFFEMENVWCILSSTTKLRQILVRDLESGKMRDDSEQFIHSYLKFQEVKPPIINMSLARELSERIETLYRAVYKLPTHTQTQSVVVPRWNQMANSNPRSLIRFVIDHLDRQRL